MSPFILTTSVVLLVFNRPAETDRVFTAIRESRPPRLFIVADGPRVDRPNESLRCAQVRHIVEQVDWPCEVHHNYSDVNLGCRQRVSTGLDWVFAQVEEAIILEDDCLPDPTFFRFCQEMLEKYRNDSRVASIGGNSFQFDSLQTSNGYCFSIYNHIWGWASWKRAWMDYDVYMSKWPSVRSTDWLSNIFSKKMDAYYWKANFEKVYFSELDTWDYQWTFANWLNNRLSIIPSVNLVSNIGFGAEATHTKSVDSLLASIPVVPMEFPLSHPQFVIRDTVADAKVQSSIFARKKWLTLVLILKYFVKSKIKWLRHANIAVKLLCLA
jgi:hypothetical protein